VSDPRIIYYFRCMNVQACSCIETKIMPYTSLARPEACKLFGSLERGIRSSQPPQTQGRLRLEALHGSATERVGQSVLGSTQLEICTQAL
jgi:hypothetical protein